MSLTALKGYLDTLHRSSKHPFQWQALTPSCVAVTAWIFSQILMFFWHKENCIINNLHEPPTEFHSEQASNKVCNISKRRNEHINQPVVEALLLWLRTPPIHFLSFGKIVIIS